MNVPYPSDAQITCAVEKIKEKAISERDTVFGFLRKMVKQMGLRMLLADTMDAAVVAFAVFLAVGTAVPRKICGLPDEEQLLGVFLFVFSPFFFALFSVLSMWKERADTLYQLKMTCKYTSWHLLTFRMFVLSIVSFGINGAYVAVLCFRVDLSVVRMLCICFSSLFLFSLLSVAVLLRSDIPAAVGLTYLLWIGGSAGAFWMIPEVFGAILFTVPVGIWIAVDSVLLIALCSHFVAYVNRRKGYVSC